MSRDEDLYNDSRRKLVERAKRNDKDNQVSKQLGVAIFVNRSGCGLIIYSTSLEKTAVCLNVSAQLAR